MRRRTHRTERVAEAVRHTVAMFLTADLRDPRIGFVTVTGVRVSRDLSHAWISVSVMGVPEERERSLTGLASAAGYLRVQLAHERETETRCAAGDRDARVHQRMV